MKPLVIYGIKRQQSLQRETFTVLIQDEIIQITADIVKLKGLYSSVLSSAEVEKGILRILSQSMVHRSLERLQSFKFVKVLRTGRHQLFSELTDEVDECQNQIRVQAKKVRSKLKRFKKENDARIEADSEITGSFLDRCARKSPKIQSSSCQMRPVQIIKQLKSLAGTPFQVALDLFLDLTQTANINLYKSFYSSYEIVSRRAK